jgi:hypothetical protein
MITMTWRILWIPVAGLGGAAVGVELDVVGAGWLCDREVPPQPAIRDPARLSIVTAIKAEDGREALIAR